MSKEDMKTLEEQIAQARYYKAASAALDEALQEDPENSEALFGKSWALLADVFIENECGAHFDVALTYLHKAAETAMDPIPLWRDFANLLVNYHCLAYKGVAISLCDRILAVFPHDLDALTFKAIALHDLRRHQGSLELSNRILELDPANLNGWIYKGWALYYLSRYKQAIDCFDQALKQQPHLAKLLVYRGTMLLALGRPEEALSSIDRALAVDPGNETAKAYRANALLALGRG